MQETPSWFTSLELERHEDQAQRMKSRVQAQNVEVQNSPSADQVQHTRAVVECESKCKRNFGGLYEGIWPKSDLCHDVVPDYEPAMEASWDKDRSELDEEKCSSSSASWNKALADQIKSILVEKRPAQWTDQLIAKKKQTQAS
ncbi:hypothetical protein F511_18254 [Dorcoceras hygrometricum]|uniref:Uncharacterized protein n=1 Tax=Dorcoceras hygrometricum TaxID=472368 RepID=A0A2Z7BGI5_9LAMI|nr:hypothetical protein F511_18254 [Dorcoceras hygrometricum]